ncbi:hypothetical protein LJB99_06935 [Deltaproteobacteria bacterium OttesenSCG-928-K17]|nr:hypothetical protein [Deltaproteobacteria bacterium OttesenSCG-928-K17]
MSVTGKIDFKVPFQLTRTLAAGRHALPGRGMNISEKLIKIEVKNTEEAITKAAEDRANQLLGRKVDEMV